MMFSVGLPEIADSWSLLLSIWIRPPIEKSQSWIVTKLCGSGVFSISISLNSTLGPHKTTKNRPFNPSNPRIDQFMTLKSYAENHFLNGVNMKEVLANEKLVTFDKMC